VVELGVAGLTDGFPGTAFRSTPSRGARACNIGGGLMAASAGISPSVAGGIGGKPLLMWWLLKSLAVGANDEAAIGFREQVKTEEDAGDPEAGGQLVRTGGKSRTKRSRARHDGGGEGGPIAVAEAGGDAGGADDEVKPADADTWLASVTLMARTSMKAVDRAVRETTAASARSGGGGEEELAGEDGQRRAQNGEQEHENDLAWETPKMCRKDGGGLAGKAFVEGEERTCRCRGRWTAPCRWRVPCAGVVPADAHGSPTNATDDQHAEKGGTG